MSLDLRAAPPTVPGIEIRVRGRVQGVGFRPAVWRLARELGLSGEVLNDAEGVIIRAAGDHRSVARLVERLRSAAPALARIERIDSRPTAQVPTSGFRIAETVGGAARTQVTPDAAICPACAGEVLDPRQRRHGYAFANCTQCGPRFSIATAIPYDRQSTTMADFAMCGSCRAEYGDPADRRFHAEAIACPACGPQARLLRVADGTALPFDADAIGRALHEGAILALKGIGGYQLACDATNADAVARLRQAKHRPAKPFALMARDLAVVQRYCRPSPEEARLLAGPEGPIVLLRATGPDRLPDAVAPGMTLHGFMLPTTPLHLLVLRLLDRPLVMTSGNVSDEPQVTDDADARCRLGGVADLLLPHDRPIASRIDDSVLRVLGGTARLLRRARGFAPAAIRLPAGFERAPDLLAMGGQVKATFCLLKDGQAILSQHQGDLEDAATHDDFRRNLALYAQLFAHAPHAVVADPHPEYLASKLARERVAAEGLPLIEAQHHHAHVASCLAENGRPLAAPPVLGIVLDGIGWGTGGEIWGGEFLLADYGGAMRLATLKPVAMLGGANAAREPWRNLYAHLASGIGWASFAAAFGALELHGYLASKPRAVLDSMLRKGINAPPASSCGRLFDAVAAALDICRERQSYEGEAAMRLEATVDEAALREEDEALAYPFAVGRLPASDLPCLDSAPMWRALLGDLCRHTPAPLVATRFHRGFGRAVAAMARRLAQAVGGHGPGFDTVALSGGCFQNAVLFGEVVRRLEAEGFSVLTHRQVPANDGGLALGQAAIGAARLLAAGR